MSAETTGNLPQMALEGAYLATVSPGFLADWQAAVQRICRAEDLQAALARAGIAALPEAAQRVSHDQIVRLYREIVALSGDEMMGLWSRPIRVGALKYLCTALAAAQSLTGALHRFAQFWNLLLDDAELSLEGPDALTLRARDGAALNPFGQMLILKLAHGLMSWLAARELALTEVSFPFARPAFAADYAVIFPAPVRFEAPCAGLRFGAEFDRPLPAAPLRDLEGFLARAPRDWIFTRHVGHALHLALRERLMRQLQNSRYGLREAARDLGFAPRTLSRRLAEEGESFQAIKDALRRDLAMAMLREERAVADVAWELGFSSVAVFTRAFAAWTGQTPAAFRRQGARLSRL